MTIFEILNKAGLSFCVGCVFVECRSYYTCEGKLMMNHYFEGTAGQNWKFGERVGSAVDET